MNEICGKHRLDVELGRIYNSKYYKKLCKAIQKNEVPQNSQRTLIQLRDDIKNLRGHTNWLPFVGGDDKNKPAKHILRRNIYFLLHHPHYMATLSKEELHAVLANADEKQLLKLCENVAKSHKKIFASILSEVGTDVINDSKNSRSHIANLRKLIFGKDAPILDLSRLLIDSAAIMKPLLFQDRGEKIFIKLLSQRVKPPLKLFKVYVQKPNE